MMLNAFSFLILTICQVLTTVIPELHKQAPVRISAEAKDAACPYLTKDQQGNVVLSWVQQQQGEQYLMYYAVSKDGGKTFGAPKAIPTSKGAYVHEENLSKILFRKNGDILAVFASNNPSPSNKYAGMLYYTQSFDGGKTWTASKQLSPGGKSSNDERYFDLAELSDGSVGAIWLDSRKGGVEASAAHTAHQAHAAGSVSASAHAAHSEGSSLYFARAEGRKGFISEQKISSKVCQCCRTRLYLDEQGQIHATYRAILNDSIRDMMHQASTDNGQHFSAPQRISDDNWAIRACPHTGPTMVSNAQGLHFAWYTMGSGQGIFYTQSKDGGKSFAPRNNVSALPSAKHPQMVALPDGNLLIVWDEKITQEAVSGSGVSLQQRSVDGRIVRTEALTEPSQRATHPVIVATGSQEVVVAYTQHGEKGNAVYVQALALP